MINVISLWNDYNKSANALMQALNRTNNLVGEYAEYLVLLHYGGEQLKESCKSADIKTNDGKLIQVKARKINKTNSTQLGIIRSWDFDLLVVILFNEDGSILKGLEVSADIAEEYAVPNKHQNGFVITTSKSFLEDSRSKDITSELLKIS